MKNETWIALQQHLTAFEGLCAPGATDIEIARAEAELGDPFPLDYKSFLRRYASAVVGAYPILGLRPCEAIGLPWSVVEQNHKFRQEPWAGTEGWFLVSWDLGGNPVGIAPNGQVLVSDHDFGGVHQLGCDFEDFIRHACLKLPG